MIAYKPFCGVGLFEMMRLATEKDAMVRKYCSMRQATDEMENYISCRASAVLMRWDMRNLRPQEWDDETLRRQLWNVCSNARLDYLRRMNARKRTGLPMPAKQEVEPRKIYWRGLRLAV